MNNPSSNNHLYLHIPYRKDLTMRKILVISIILSSLAFAQNDGLVVTNYPSGALHTEGNYANGVRDGLWTIWYEGEVFQDYGADGEPNTQDEGEGNGVWDSTETVTLDLDGDTFFEVIILTSSPLYKILCKGLSLPLISHAIVVSPILVCTA